MDKRAVGNRIKEARVAAGLTQEDAGLKIGISQSRLSAYERGRVGGVTLDVLEAIARATGQPLIWFLNSVPPVEPTLDYALRRTFPDLTPEYVRQILRVIQWCVTEIRSEAEPVDDEDPTASELVEIVPRTTVRHNG